MTTDVDPNHPQIILGFYVVGSEFDPALQESIKKLIEDMAGKRQWLIRQPAYVNEIVRDDDEPDLDPPDWFLGGELSVYSGYERDLPREIDLQLWHDAEFFIREVENFSREHGTEFTVAYNGEEIGDVKNGEADVGVKRHFLGEWRQAIENS